MKMVLLYKLRSANPSTKQFKGYIFMLCVYIKPPQTEGFTESIWLFTYSQRLINTFLSTCISFQSNNHNDNCRCKCNGSSHVSEKQHLRSLCVKNYTCAHFCKDLFVCLFYNRFRVNNGNGNKACIHSQSKEAACSGI